MAVQARSTHQSTPIIPDLRGNNAQNVRGNRSGNLPFRPCVPDWHEAEFDKAAVAVEDYRFDPALEHGKPVPVKVCVEVTFRRY